MLLFMCVFYFYKQKTSYEMRISDWSSDVCSSDLPARAGRPSTRDDAPARPDAIADRAENRRSRSPAAARPLHHRHAARATAIAAQATNSPAVERKGVWSGKSVSGRVDIGGSRIIKKKKNIQSII